MTCAFHHIILINWGYFMDVNNQDLLGRLIDQTAKNHSVSARYEYYHDVHAFTEPGNILLLLGLDRNSLPNTVLETVDFLEKGENYDPSDYIDLKWKLSAFLNMQDIFDHPFYIGTDPLTCMHLWYFYFESKFILIESFLSGLCGFYLSSKILMRLFIEFNVAQNYYYRTITKDSSYSCLDKYFKKYIRPKFDTMMKKALPDDNFSKPIRRRLHIHWNALSDMPVHSYHPALSEKNLTGFLPRVCAEGIFFWFYQKYILEAILWMYYVNFPMLFHPVNSLEKYGFNGPVGGFIDFTRGHIIKKSMTENDFNLFLDHSNNSQYVKSTLNGFNSMKTLSEQQIIESWNSNEPFKGIVESYIVLMAKERVTKELLSFPQFIKSQDDNDELNHTSFAYEKWKESYKKFGKMKPPDDLR